MLQMDGKGLCILLLITVGVGVTIAIVAKRK